MLIDFSDVEELLSEVDDGMYVMSSLSDDVFSIIDGDERTLAVFVNKEECYGYFAFPLTHFYDESEIKTIQKACEMIEDKVNEYNARPLKEIAEKEELMKQELGTIQEKFDGVMDNLNERLVNDLKDKLEDGSKESEKITKVLRCGNDKYVLQGDEETVALAAGLINEFRELEERATKLGNELNKCDDSDDNEQIKLMCSQWRHMVDYKNIVRLRIEALDIEVYKSVQTNEVLCDGHNQHDGFDYDEGKYDDGNVVF